MVNHKDIKKHVEAYVKQRIKKYRSNSMLSNGRLTYRDIFSCIVIVESYRCLGVIGVRHKICDDSIIITYTTHGDVFERYSIKIKGVWFNGD